MFMPDSTNILLLQGLESLLRQVRAINTVGGLQDFSFVVACECEEVNEVLAVMRSCGFNKCHIGYVHFKHAATCKYKVYIPVAIFILSFRI